MLALGLSPLHGGLHARLARRGFRPAPSCPLQRIDVEMTKIAMTFLLRAVSWWPFAEALDKPRWRSTWERRLTSPTLLHEFVARSQVRLGGWKRRSSRPAVRCSSVRRRIPRSPNRRARGARGVPELRVGSNSCTALCKFRSPFAHRAKWDANRRQPDISWSPKDHRSDGRGARRRALRLAVLGAFG